MTPRGGQALLAECNNTSRFSDSYSSRRNGAVGALDVSERWLLDTGAARDLISQEAAHRFPVAVHEAQPLNFHTANGTIMADQMLRFSTLPNERRPTGTAYVLPDSPSALSIGRRVMRGGMSFVWLA